MKRSDWTRGNAAQLLENGDAFFPRVFEALGQARQLALLETFILKDDKVGRALCDALCGCAGRGVRTVLTIDGFGSPGLSEGFLGRLTGAGVQVRIFDPGRSLFGQQLNLLRRMHRKLVVVDDAVAFVGGINFCADQLLDFGEMAKQDYAVELRGPIVGRIRAFMQRTANTDAAPPRAPVARAGTAAVLFAARDDKASPDGIEKIYRQAIRTARSRVCIANAYFFPGYRLFRDLCRAAGRGVEVKLFLQGMPDMKSVRFAARLLYGHLLRAGVEVHEYCARPMHGKIAIVDDGWATVGSSNLDPLSLALNMEANVVVISRSFNAQVAARLAMLETHCEPVRQDTLPFWNRWPPLGSFIVFHVLRWVSRVGAWLPRRPQRVKALGGRADAGQGPRHRAPPLR
ncbi:cardiolipin synthase ClsB [Variovorax sp. EBFNA2]|uniref:cardiolipin synthase ClsB n=1 Tax=Variovorax sp. EBFNA2 TaxID=3342097 RepID=UPI0029BFB026|nr:cardiolipin synthase ClsB [Variovorax boronicumulans]WPG39551.1 cardiolipin synthase ClsB [Variovorax boronicumulans]